MNQNASPSKKFFSSKNLIYTSNSSKNIFAAIVLCLCFIYSLFQMKFAYFYNDDFFLMEHNSVSTIFSFYNGHWIPIVNGLYLLLFQVFGVASYMPWLTLALILFFLGWIFLYKAFASTGSRILLGLILTKSLLIKGSEQTLSWTSVSLNFFVFGLVFAAAFSSERYRSKTVMGTCLILVGIGGYGIPGLCIFLFQELASLRKSKKIKLTTIVVTMSFLISICVHLYAHVADASTFAISQVNMSLANYFHFICGIFNNSILAAFPWKFATPTMVLVIAIASLYFSYNKIRLNKNASYLLIYELVFWSLIFLTRSTGGNIPSRYVSISSSALLLCIYFLLQQLLSQLRIKHWKKGVSILLAFASILTSHNVIGSLKNVSWEGRIVQGDLSAVLCSYKTYHNKAVLINADSTLIYVHPEILFSRYSYDNWSNLEVNRLKVIGGPAIASKDAYATAAKEPLCVDR